MYIILKSHKRFKTKKKTQIGCICLKYINPYDYLEGTITYFDQKEESS